MNPAPAALARGVGGPSTVLLGQLMRESESNRQTDSLLRPVQFVYFCVCSEGTMSHAWSWSAERKREPGKNHIQKTG